MRAHDGLGARGDPRSERDEFGRIQVLVIGRDDRESEVRVFLGVAVAWKVFQGRDHTMVFETPHVGLDEGGDRGGALPEGAHVDDRVQRIVVEIGIRGEIH